jgi:parallel beta-helix repeat protein
VRQIFPLVVALLGVSAYGQVTINPGDNIQSKISANSTGTTFIINPGTYRITTALAPKTGDSFVGATACNPIVTAGSCTAVISGSTSIGSLATYDSTSGFYKVTGQTQQGTTVSTSDCISGYDGCIYPEDLFWDGVPQVHVYSSSIPSTLSSNQWWFDYTNNIIYFPNNPSGHTVEASVATNAFVGPANNVTLQYLTIEEFAAPIQNAAVYPQYSSTTDAAKQANGINWVIENSEIWGAHGNGVSLNYGTQVLFSYVHTNGNLGVSGGLGVSTTTPVPSCSGFATAPFCAMVQGSTLSSNNYANVDPGFQGGGFKMGRSFNILVRGNTITNNEGAGIHFDVSSYGGLVDGNYVNGNTDADGITYEIGSTQSGNHPVFRNNVAVHNGAVALVNEWPAYQMSSRTSLGVEAYCNVMEIANSAHTNGFEVDASSRGTDTNYPGATYAAINNNFHHNTVIWDSGSTGQSGYFWHDTSGQPNFFANNTPPDYNTYHLVSTTAADFIYGNLSGKTFGTYEGAGADPHGTVDTVYASGYPSIAISAPADQTTFANLISAAASASDTSGIRKVEWYVDWNLNATATTAPYRFHWANFAAATHTVAAMAYSNAGVRACYAVTLNMMGGADPGGIVF